MLFKNVPNKSHKIGDKVIWESRSCATVGVVILQYKGKYYILMEKRGSAAPDGVGKWVLPCGYLDHGETLAESCIREIWEETGVNVPEIIGSSEVLEDSFSLGQPSLVNSTFDDPTNPLQNVSNYFFLHSKVKKLPVLTTEHNEVLNEVEEAKWVPIEEFAELDIGFHHKDRIYLFLDHAGLI